MDEWVVDGWMDGWMASFGRTDGWHFPFSLTSSWSWLKHSMDNEYGTNFYIYVVQLGQLSLILKVCAEAYV